MVAAALKGIDNLTFYRGRVALHTILRSLNVGPGDEVAIQAFTCVAVAEGVIATGARPVYVDIEKDGLNMSAADLERKLTPRTRAIVIQHTFGVPADMDSLLAVAELRSIPVIEDCCHTFLSSYAGKRVGSFGSAAFYSFEWGKPLVAGVGGAAIANELLLHEGLVTLHSALAPPPLLRVLRIELQWLAYVLLYRPQFYWCVKSLFHWLSARGMAEGSYNPIGRENPRACDFGFRMSYPVRFRLSKGLNSIATIAAKARHISAAYQKGLGVTGVHRPHIPPKARVVFNRYPIFVDDKATLLQDARRAGVEVSEWYASPVHPLSHADMPLVYYEVGSCPEAERAARRIVSLPTNARTSVRYVNKVIRFFQDRYTPRDVLASRTTPVGHSKW